MKVLYTVSLRSRKAGVELLVFANGAQTAAFAHLFNAEGILKKMIDSTSEAIDHYYNGNGEQVELGPNTKSALINHPSVVRQSNALRSGTAKHLNSNLGVDMTGDVFHVGDTAVVFTTSCSSSECTTNYTGFVEAHNPGMPNIIGSDGFRDPLSLGFEIGGTPYDYSPYTWSETYPNRFK